MGKVLLVEDDAGLRSQLRWALEEHEVFVAGNQEEALAVAAAAQAQVAQAQVAAAAGSPRAVRAVGTACRRNPLPIAIPCHRVVRSDGALGQYAGGVEAKRLLLDVEAASPPVLRAE